MAFTTKRTGGMYANKDTTALFGFSSRAGEDPSP